MNCLIYYRAVKSLLASKLIYAQGKGIDASFEANNRVVQSWLDPMVLVRVLGIFLDNAIEEVEALGDGSLKVAVIKYPTSLQIIIENTCREKVEKPGQLRKAGYSTKGSDRGIGLTNVDELLRNIENTTLETIINHEKFTQILYICETNDSSQD